MTSPINRKSKASKEEENSEITIQDVTKEAQSVIDKVFADVGKTSATQQLIMGTASGWLTGYLMMKVGKMAAIAVGGGIILLQIANHKGYVKVNWDRIYKNVEEQVEKIDASTSAKKGPKILEKMEKYVDRKLDKAETLLKKKERKAKMWYNKLTNSDDIVIQEIHVFMASFILGISMGIVCGRIL